MTCRTIHDVNDGSAGGTSACRKYPLPRDDPNSRTYAMIQGQTSVGQVLQVHISCCLDVSGIDIPILSTMGNGSKSRITKATTATWSSYVLMIQTKILVNHKGVERPIAMQSEPGQANMEISWSIEETHASQPKIQSNPENGHSEDSIPSKERKWNDILANRNLKRNTFESDVAKLVMKLVRHHDQEERETDGAVHWKPMGPKLRFAFHK